MTAGAGRGRSDKGGVPAPPPGPLEADVVVVGGGLAGHCAAIEAAHAGAECVLLEKQDVVGGSTALSEGFFAFCPTDEQRAAGVDDSPELLLKDLWAISGHHADRALLRAYVDEQRSVYRWLTGQGLTFSQPLLSGGQSVPRSHRTDPAALLAVLAGQARRLEVTTVSQARVRRLRRSASGAVVGCTAGIRGQEVEVTARRGVVLATGGFSLSPELLEVFAPRQRNALPIGGAGNVGDGLRMGWELGADLRDMGFVKGTFGTHPRATTTSRHALLLAFYKGAIVVNTAGKRFIDESLSYKDIGDACLLQPDRLGVQVFDVTTAERCNTGIPLFDLAEPRHRGLLIERDSVEELAREAGVDPTGLQATVDSYNADVRAYGKDTALGRTGLVNGVGELAPICTPPFYAYPSTTTLLGTYCGLRIGADAQVVNVWGEPIPRLYAAGEVTGGFHGAAYMTGSALGKAAAFGRIAGRSASTTRPAAD
ncbi:MAG: FAD-dependent oxidoreductase [Actinomycetota bacterium]|nr:FAD-dependent oxidoreductase [Actinomycetota bacterium]